MILSWRCLDKCRGVYLSRSIDVVLNGIYALGQAEEEAKAARVEGDAGQRAAEERSRRLRQAEAAIAAAQAEASSMRERWQQEIDRR